MRILVESGKVEERESDMLTVGIFENEEKLDGLVKDIDVAMDGAITSLVKSGDFKGRLNQTLLLYTYGKLKARRLLLVGLGKKEEFGFEAVRSAAGKAVKEVRGLNVTKYVSLVYGEGSWLPLDGLVQALVEGSELALYTFDRFKSEKEEPKPVEEMTIFLKDEGSVPLAKSSVLVAQAACDATKLARDITNAPSSDMNPTVIAELAKKMAEEHSLKCTVLEPKDMEQLGMGGILGVAKGSQQPARLVVLEYRGAGDERPVVLVGKGVTFDSGGISIKPSEKMEEMKYDKAGAAAVIAVMKAVASLKLPINVVSITPLVENLPSGSAYKPGDVLKHYGGKTSEVISTDAEGRLILADALAYAQEFKPKAIIDVATLTGACVIALGTHASGLFSNDKELVKRIVEASEFTGERVWELPLWKEYLDQIKSEVADIKNTGGRPGGAITAAAFLKHFVAEHPWAHIDIAGTAYTQEGSAEKTYVPKGATGVGVRLLLHLLRNWPKGP